MKERIEGSVTRQFKAIFPGVLNGYNTLFGGTAMKWMDEVAYITAIRFTRQRMVTVSTEKMHFLLPIKPDSIAEIIAKVVRVKNVTLDILVEVYIEDMYSPIREKAAEALFTFAAVNDHNKPVPLGSN
jgi:acyl-CoA hydrolase